MSHTCAAMIFFLKLFCSLMMHYCFMFGFKNSFGNIVSGIIVTYVIKIVNPLKVFDFKPIFKCSSLIILNVSE